MEKNSDEIRVEIEDGKAKLYTPYNKDFIEKIKGFGGKWDGRARAWTVDEEVLDTAREIMSDVYGYNDKAENVTVDLIVTVKCQMWGDREPIFIFGKEVARAWGRDSGARAGDGVYFLEGKPESGGSRNNWATIVNEGCRIKLLQVNRNVFEKQKPEFEDYITVEEVKPENKNEQLLKEKKKLLARLDEINRLLGEE